MAEVEESKKSWGLELAYHPFFLILVVKASQMTEIWCWEGPTELNSVNGMDTGEGWRTGVIIENVSEKKYGGSNEAKYGRKLFFQRLTIEKHQSQVPLWVPCHVQASFHFIICSTEELTISWCRLFRLEDLQEVISGTWYLFASSLWSWFWYIGFWSSSHSYNRGKCTDPVVLVSQSLSELAVGKSAQSGAGPSPLQPDATVPLTEETCLKPSLLYPPGQLQWVLPLPPYHSTPPSCLPLYCHLPCLSYHRFLPALL